MRQFVDKKKIWLAQSPSKNKIVQAFAVTGKANVSQLHIKNVIESDSRYTIRDITKTIAGAPHFEAYFESTKDFCHMDIAYMIDD